jgi:coatomer subunit beta
MTQLDLEDEEFSDANRFAAKKRNEDDFSARLNRMVQLTGYSDPVYAEAVVTVHQYDIVLEITIGW